MRTAGIANFVRREFAPDIWIRERDSPQPSTQAVNTMRVICEQESLVPIDRQNTCHRD
jgi:hypothetical protein